MATTNTNTKFRDIVFLQGDESFEAMDIIARDEAAGVDYLAQWDTGEGEILDSEPWGTSDTIFRHGDYVLSYNTRLDYCSLVSVE